MSNAVVIKPVSPTARPKVAKVLLRFLGPQSQTRVEELMQNGGVVLDGLNDQAAARLEKLLLKAGAEVERAADEEKPWVTGRRPFGRIFVANSDADVGSNTRTAIDQAWRSVEEAVG